jgi:hypothetical protein
MNNLRRALIVGVVLVSLAGAAAGFFLLEATSRDAALLRLAVDAATALALAVTVGVLLSPTLKRLDELVEGLRALSRGEKHQRLEAAHFAGLADVARAANEVAAAMCEGDDPNLGPVIKKPRAQPVAIHKEPRPSKVQPRAPVDIPGVRLARADEGLVGEPRKSSAAPAREPAAKALAVAAAAPTTPAAAEPAASSAAALVASPGTSAPTTPPVEVPGAEGVGEPRPSRKARKAALKAQKAASRLPQEAGSDQADQTDPEDAAGPANDEAAPPQPPPPTNDTVIDDAPASEGEPPSEARLPDDEELRGLYQEFVTQKGGQEDTDFPFETFQETIRAEAERLLAAHQCRGVRFEVAVADGEVSLRPRLLR